MNELLAALILLNAKFDLVHWVQALLLGLIVYYLHINRTASMMAKRYDRLSADEKHLLGEDALKVSHINGIWQAVIIGVIGIILLYPVVMQDSMGFKAHWPIDTHPDAGGEIIQRLVQIAVVWVALVYFARLVIIWLIEPRYKLRSAHGVKMVVYFLRSHGLDRFDADKDNKKKVQTLDLPAPPDAAPDDA